MKIFISGGCKNGKSSIAEDVCVKLARGGKLYYIATMLAYDDEDNARIKRHRESRAGKGFETIEQGTDILKVLDKSDYKNGTFLLDSVTALMINELYRDVSAHSELDYKAEADPDAPERVASGLISLARKLKNIVFVSDFIYSEKDSYSKFTEDYLRALAYVDKALAEECDTVIEVCLANTNIYKGELPV